MMLNESEPARLRLCGSVATAPPALIAIRLPDRVAVTFRSPLSVSVVRVVTSGPASRPACCMSSRFRLNAPAKALSPWPTETTTAAPPVAETMPVSLEAVTNRSSAAIDAVEVDRGDRVVDVEVDRDRAGDADARLAGGGRVGRDRVLAGERVGQAPAAGRAAPCLTSVPATVNAHSSPSTLA